MIASMRRMDQCQRLLTEVRARAADQRRPLVVAIDGRSGAGKSTVARWLGSELEAVVVEADDFYAGGSDVEWAARTPAERVEQVIDWRRLRHEALAPLAAGRAAAWRPFDFERGAGFADRIIARQPAPVVILDGAYSARPELADLVDLAVLVQASTDRVRRARLLAREGAAFMAAWHTLWDAAEDLYFSQIRPPESFDLIVTTTDGVAGGSVAGAGGGTNRNAEAT
jgi:uridine kinase